MLCFTSTIGVRPERPDLGVVEFAGRRDYNAVFTSDLASRAPIGLSGGPNAGRARLV